MLFEEVLPLIRAGKKARRRGWPSDFRPVDASSIHAMSASSLFATDWEIESEHRSVSLEELKRAWSWVAGKDLSDITREHIVRKHFFRELGFEEPTHAGY